MPSNAVDRFVVARDKEAALHLSPGVFPAGRQAEWTEQNRTLTFSLHPLATGVAMAVAGKQPRELLGRDLRVYEPDQRVYICRMSPVPDERLPFASDTHAVFVALQSLLEAAAAEDVALGVGSLLRMSALYREAMLRQVRLLQEAGAQTEFTLGEIDSFQSMHAVWHLLEIIYLTTNAPALSTSIVPHFMEWLNFNFPAPLAEDGQRIIDRSTDADALARDGDLWPYLKKLALRGHVVTLANVLERLAPAQRLSAPAARWARDLARVSREMPIGSSEETAGSFNARWRQWNAELQNMATAIRSLLAGGDDSDDSDSGTTTPTPKDIALDSLGAIADIMRGDADAASADGETWQDILGAILLYSEPTSQADRLPGLAHIVLEQFQTGEFTLLDRTLVALLNHDLPEFLVYCNQIDPWLSAHLADIMDHISILDICRRVFSVDPREHYLIALGEAYMGHESLWRAGLDYFGLCGTRSGTSVMVEYIVRIPLESDRMAQQVLRVCEKYGLADAKGQIHRQLGRQKWRRGRLGAAIGHFARVEDRNAIELICDQLWTEYLESGKLTYGPIIDGVMAAGLRHDRLQFLTQYRDFHECYRAGDYAAAGRILLTTLLSETAPPHAVADLLVDSIPLLEGDSLVFSSDDTFELMRCAEALVQSPFPAGRRSAAPATGASTIDQDELSIFNVACARNLARSFVMS
ncbi:hypothetical protein LPJ61_001655 [Coemansia biformis]|uniref:Nuclear pore complex protein Nup85 n=1 Tax=Coemansia biformis TaxID=1286918 RepID=A0A9W8CXW9_9FUNG|nr:hypothetical protein LPJ61_001655 [Coemansia biformis]